ncbi:MAG: sulfatase-like hydrolase/transferase, partial [bacterium]
MGSRRRTVVAALATLSLAAGVGVAGSPSVTARTVVPYEAGSSMSAALSLPPGDVSVATPSVEPAGAPGKPNVIVILTDDQRAGTVAGMPFTTSYLRDRGIEFTNAHSPTSTCCPARSTFLTGNHAPKTGVWTNWQPYGGWAGFHPLEESTLALSLQEAGYRTGLVGKYLNGYADPRARVATTGDANYVPPGWDEWHTFGVPASVKDPDVIRLSDQGYYEYWLMSRGMNSAQPTYAFHGSKPRDYSTDVLGAERDRRRVGVVLRLDEVELPPD